MSEIFKTFKGGEKKITPAVAHKEWVIPPSETSSLGINYFEGKHYNYLISKTTSHIFNTEDSQFSSNEASVPTTNHAGTIYYKKLMHDSIDHLYYGEEDTPVTSFCNDAPHLLDKRLSRSTKIISIPSGIFGEKIKPGTLEYSCSAYVLTDDGKGNLLNTADTTGSIAMAAISSSILFTDFSDSWRALGGLSIAAATIPTSSIFIEAASDYKGMAHNMNYSSGSTSIAGGYTGEAIFHGSHSLEPTHSIDNPSNNSYIRIAGSKGLDLGDDWAISLWVNIPPTQATTQSYSGNYDNSTNNNSTKIRNLKDRDRSVIFTTREWWSRNCPMEISVYNDNHASEGKLRLDYRSTTSGFTTGSTSTATYNDGAWHHLLINKPSGDNLYFYIDGIAISNLDYIPPDFNTKASSDIYLGARPYGYKKTYKNPNTQKWNTVKDQRNFIDPFSGSISNLRIYDASVNTSTISEISSSVDQTNIVGNVFYEHGIATVTATGTTDSSQLYDHAWPAADSTLTFKGTHAIKEHLYLCNILDGEFNSTYNPTARENYDIENDNLQAYTTHSEFNPYITSIGLYTDKHELVAVGKLAQPIKNQDDYDNTFQIRFDTTV